jgi:hypothetical protein
MTQYKRIALTACVFAGIFMLTSCATFEPPQRTLPEHIKRLYIPEFRNASRLFGGQADLTLYVNDAFLSDGRIDVVQNGRADARLEGRITEYKSYNTGSSSDRWPLVTALEMECNIELWDPYDADRVAPIARYTVPAVVQYVSDERRSIMETDTEARERLLRQMATNIVQTVITGVPDAAKPIERAKIQRYQERHNPAQQEPVFGEPRFPKPTPPVQ